MDKAYPTELALLQGQSQRQNLDNIQSELVAEQLAALNGRYIALEDKLNRVLELLSRRTAVLSPSRGVEDVLFTGKYLFDAYERADELIRLQGAS